MIYPLPNVKLEQEPCAWWEGFFTEQELKEIESLEFWNNQQPAYVGHNRDSVVNKDLRKTKISWLPVNEKTEWIYKRIAETVVRVNHEYFHLELGAMYEQIQLGVYDSSENGHYDWHTDEGKGDSGMMFRKLSFAMLLNDPSEFEGGQLQLKYWNDEVRTVDQRKGRAWLFPSYTLHRVTPVTKGIRKSLVCWIGGAPFK